MYGQRPSRQTDGVHRSWDQVRLPSANQPEGGTILLSGLQTTHTRKNTRTLEVQAGEYPFGVANGFPLEL